MLQQVPGPWKGGDEEGQRLHLTRREFLEDHHHPALIFVQYVLTDERAIVVHQLLVPTPATPAAIS